MGDEHKEIFLSCFKCGRIVRASDNECPRCGLQFAPGTLFECPFCSGLVWRNDVVCKTCGTDLSEFSAHVADTSSSFNMDEFIDTVIDTELKEIKSMTRRFACPGCGLMIRGDEAACPRCDLPLTDAKVDCPVCGEKIPLSAVRCPSCEAVFEDLTEEPSEEVPEEDAEEVTVSEEPAAEKLVARAPAKRRPSKKKPVQKKTKARKSR